MRLNLKTLFSTAQVLLIYYSSLYIEYFSQIQYLQYQQHTSLFL